MAAPTFVQASTGATDAGGAWAFTGAAGTSGNLVILHIFRDGYGPQADVALTGASNIEALDGTANTWTDITASQPYYGTVGSSLEGMNYFWFGRLTGSSAPTASGTNATSHDLYARFYEFTGVHSNTTVSSIIEGLSEQHATSGTISDVGITTTGRDRLALQFIAISDDNAQSNFTGETGGNWTEAVTYYAESSGTDASIGLQIARPWDTSPQQLSLSAGYIFGENASINLFIGQSFTPSTTGSLYEVTLWLRKVGSPTDDLTVSIYSDSDNHPNASLASAPTLSGSTLTTLTAAYKFTFASPPSLTGGSKYWIVITRSGAADAANYYAWSFDSSNPYANHGLGVSATAAGISENSIYDAGFAIVTSGSTGGTIDGGTFTNVDATDGWGVVGFALLPTNPTWYRYQYAQAQATIAITPINKHAQTQATITGGGPATYSGYAAATATIIRLLYSATPGSDTVVKYVYNNQTDTITYNELSIPIYPADSTSSLVVVFYRDVNDETPTITGGGRTWIWPPPEVDNNNVGLTIYRSTDTPDASDTRLITLSWTTGNFGFAYVYEIANANSLTWGVTSSTGTISSSTANFVHPSFDYSRQAVMVQAVLTDSVWASDGEPDYFQQVFISTWGANVYPIGSFWETAAFSHVTQSSSFGYFGSGFDGTDYVTYTIFMVSDLSPIGLSQALADITSGGPVTYSGFSQAQATIKAFAVKGYAQSQAIIKQTYRGYAQSSVWIKATYPRGGGDTTVAQDTFTEVSDTALTSHTPEIGGTWSSPGTGIINVIGANDWAVLSSAGGGVKNPDPFLSSTSLSDGSVYLDFEASGSRIGPAARISSNFVDGYMFVGADDGDFGVIDQVAIWRKTSSAYTMIGSLTSLSRNYPQRMRLYVSSNSPTVLKGRSWDAGGSEPGSWDVDTSDNTAANQMTSGAVGISWQGTGTQGYGTVDDFLAIQTGGGIEGPTFAQSQATIYVPPVSYKGYAQAQAQITAQVVTYRGFAQAQSQIKQTYRGYAQAQTRIRATYRGFAQAQTRIRATYRGFAQAQTRIRQTYRGYAQSQAKIKAIAVKGYAQSQARIRTTYRGYAQANAQIRQTYRGYAQSQAQIIITLQKYAQAQSQVKSTYRGYAQALGQIKQTYRSYAQAQAAILTANLVYAQATANIIQTVKAHSQAQALIYIPVYYSPTADISNNGWVRTVSN